MNLKEIREEVTVREAEKTWAKALDAVRAAWAVERFAWDAYQQVRKRTAARKAKEARP